MTEKNDSVNTRALILQQARALFLSQGYHNTTMRTIAEAAGISTGPLYFHFQNKAEVFFHICSEAYDCLIADFHRAAGQEGRAALRLRSIYYAYKSFYYQEPQLFEMIHFATNPIGGVDLPQPLQQALHSKSQQMVQIMEEIIREGISRHELRAVDPGKLALYLYSAAEGIFLAQRMGVLERAQVSLDAMIDSAVELIGLGMLESRLSKNSNEC